MTSTEILIGVLAFLLGHWIGWRRAARKAAQLFGNAMAERTADFIGKLWAKDQETVDLYNAIGPLTREEATAALRAAQLVGPQL